MKFKSSIISWLNYALLFLFGAAALCTLIYLNKNSIVSNAEVWTNLHQVVYQSILAIALIKLFLNRDIHQIVGIGLLFGSLIYFLGFFEFIHDQLATSGLYNLSVYSHFASNPQYPVLICYLVITLIFIGLQIKAKFKNVEIYFILLLLLTNLSAVYLFHMSFPGGTLKDQFNQEHEQLANTRTLSEADFAIICKFQGWICKATNTYIDSFTENDDINPLLGTEKHLMYQKNINQLLSNFDTKSDFFYQDTNRTPLIGIAYKEHNFRLIISWMRPFNIWTESLAYFSRLASVVSLIWLIFITALSFVHRNIKK